MRVPGREFPGPRPPAAGRGASRMSRNYVVSARFPPLPARLSAFLALHSMANCGAEMKIPKYPTSKLTRNGADFNPSDWPQKGNGPSLSLDASNDER